MEEYLVELNKCIRSLFDKKEIKFEINVILDLEGRIDDKKSVGIRVTHIPSGITEECLAYDTQIKNANFALILLKKKIDDFYMQS